MRKCINCRRELRVIQRLNENDIEKGTSGLVGSPFFSVVHFTKEVKVGIAIDPLQCLGKASPSAEAG